jgi:hypothetical protein
MYSLRGRSPLTSRFLPVAAVLAIAFGSSGGVLTADAKTLKRHKPKTTPALGGTWSGQYSGAYSGTFTLNWQQKGSNLSGTIKLSNPASTLGVNGSLQGTSISFGTVGGYDITYTGSVTSSGKSMSGSWRASGGKGTWSASKN